ncbi:hypothetical protein [Chromobacterium sp. ATCC 53434]|uniref:hypothetical protein n=1 Tax=Chromobacterium sp. (strain ATCC 53434 / SC 14030) TaxID=2059672 RepID=UPI00130511AE|nr:hypothetical protein [Chromobacterium sp. ATCC 53434]
MDLRIEQVVNNDLMTMGCCVFANVNDGTVCEKRNLGCRPGMAAMSKPQASRPGAAAMVPIMGVQLTLSLFRGQPS